MRRREEPSGSGNERRGRRVKQRANRGASSSRSQQQPDLEPVVDLRFGYLFNDNETEHARFMETFARRPIIKPKSLDMTFFVDEGFDIVALLETSYLTGLAEMSCPYSEVMVRAFYHNLSYINGDLKSSVCGIDIVMTAPIWKDILGFDFDAEDRVMYDGDSNVAITGFHRDQAVQEARRPGVHRAVVTVGQLTVSSRILFYVMTHILFPRAYNHSRVLEGDIPVMWSIQHGIRVNWRHYICWMMSKAKQKDTAALPYAYLVQKILEYFGVPMQNEEMVSLQTWNARFGQRLLEQCKISKVADGVLQYAGAEEGVPTGVPEGGPTPHIVPPEVPDEGDDDDVMMEDLVEPEGGFSLRDVMQAIHANKQQMFKMEAKQKKRWKWMYGRMKGLEDTLGRLRLGRPFSDDEEDPGTSADEE